MIYFPIIIAQTIAPMLGNPVDTIHTRDGEGGNIEFDTIE